VSRLDETWKSGLIPNVLRSWGIVPDAVSPISANGNQHWKVRRSSDEFVLRMYRRAQTDSSIRYELDLLQWLSRRGWPVAAAVDGMAIVDSSLVFVLFPLLPGRSAANETTEQLRRRGRILAELHRELSAITGIGQRSGWQRSDEVVRSVLADSRPGGELVCRLTQHLEHVAERLRAAGASSFPTGVIHGDFIAQNLLFQGDKLSGVIDFDSAHLDLRAVDLACARRSGGDEVARGYLEIFPLADSELDCLDDLWRASVLRYFLQILERKAVTGTEASELEWCLRQVEKTRRSIVSLDDLCDVRTGFASQRMNRRGRAESHVEIG